MEKIDIYPGEELEAITFFEEIPVKEKVSLLTVDEKKLVWMGSYRFLSVISHTREFLTKLGDKVFRFKVLSTGDRGFIFVTKQPDLIDGEIFKRQNLRVTVSRERPIKLVLKGNECMKDLSFNSFCGKGEELYPLILNVYDISTGGVGILFKEDSKILEPEIKTEMNLLFFKKVGVKTEIKEKEVSFLGEVTKKEEIFEGIVKVGIRFLSLKNSSEAYKFIFRYIIDRQREIRKLLELLVSEYRKNSNALDFEDIYEL
ncbi:PilZ domain-containing protein [Desulfurobacterium crinifex]